MIKSVAFYPEYVKKEEWEKYLLQIKAGNIDAIRFGEFAWGLIEPREGEFYWDLFDEAFEMTERLGIKVILGTPTACPPVWLCENYPEILPVNEVGNKIEFGARQHRCYNSAKYREAVTSVVTELAKRYGKKSNLFAWQIDNEIGAEHKYCYCDSCRRKFQGFLKDKYKTTEDLNRRWMNTFWAQNYTDFSQIPVPKRIEAYLPMRPHPSLQYEFFAFSGKSVVEVINLQARLIREYSDKLVTTNQDDFNYGDNVDWFDAFRELDVVAFDIYSHKMYEIGFYHDMSRSIKNKPFWMLEYGTGFPVAEMMDLATSKGCELVGLFAYNPFPAGQEHGPASMVDMFGREQKSYFTFRDWEEKAAAKPLKKVNYYYDFKSSWAYAATIYRTWETGDVLRNTMLTYKNYAIHTVYKSLFEANIQAEFVEDVDKADASVPLIMPMQLLYDAELEKKLLAFMQKGGKIITTRDLFAKNEDNAYSDRMPELYTKVFGADARYFLEKPYGLYTAEGSFGKGKLILVDVETDENGWKQIIGEQV